jgi:AmmeMemoRadiSam system protein B
MKTLNWIAVFFLGGFFCLACHSVPTQSQTEEKAELKIRALVDTIGFTQYAWQMDSLIARMDSGDKAENSKIYKAVICPHDDYAYAGGLYNKTLSGIHAKTIVLIGVAHKARIFKLENKLIFDSFDAWKGTFGLLKPSPLREEIIRRMPKETYLVHDSMMQIEHSLEAITPFLQKNNPKVEVIPLLIPYFTFEKMQSYSDKLAEVIYQIMEEKHLIFGKDLAIVISNDAIHYGDSAWSSTKMAPFGVDSLGTAKVKQKEMEIIQNCLVGKIDSPKIKLFNQYTVRKNDFKAYRWIWCGRYALPFGLLTANKLNQLIYKQSLHGKLIDWRSSIHNPHLKVSDLGMGTTAPANRHHWVAYVGISYE